MLLNLTPPAAHGKYNLMALGAGKHVYTEKPLAATYAEGREIMSLAAEKGLTAGCAPDTFWGGRIQTMRDLIDDGTIGSLTGAAGFAAYFGVESFHPNPAAFYQPGGRPAVRYRAILHDRPVVPAWPGTPLLRNEQTHL